MNCLVKIVWDWNGTLLNDVDLCFSCINRLLVSHDLKPLDTLSQYREVFTFPIEDYYKRVGFDFDKIPFSMLAHEYMEDYQEKSYACDLHSDVLDVVNKAKNLGFSQTVLSASKMDYLLKQMKTLHVDDLFDSIYGINDIYAKSKVELAHAFKQTCSRQFDSCKIINISNVAYIALFLCQIFFLFCCTNVVRRCNVWYNRSI